ncbi:MazG-like family protein [Bacillus swezeyi]|uniref:MazG-like family protein n=1 Tax=Bacillus swezeyi TaxID=1925020 RepID=UPI0027DDC739|nr:MazG-like family protein [Bacillus swezeyi]MED1739257.1 MazG-like family protein [Bacillus swezeyi]
MMLTNAEQWTKAFYQKRGWSEYGPFIRMGFLMEETGELARAVRTYEIGRDRPDEAKRPASELKQELVEEMGDVMGNLIMLAKIYDVSLEEMMESHRKKLTERFAGQHEDC